jgi:hypothetical protein
MRCCLRYAPAIVFALLALAFVGLWVRSYYVIDTAYGRVGESRQIGWGFSRGLVTIRYADLGRPIRKFQGWHFNSRPVEPDAIADNGWSEQTYVGFGRVNGVLGVVNYYFPFWLPTLIAASLAAVFAFKPITRFTVRGLLVTTTLLAAVLGLVVYAV